VGFNGVFLMIPGLGGMDPKKMAGMMKKLGIKQDVIDDVVRVVIERESGKIVIESPSVTKVEMQGQETWQIMGDAHEEAGSEVSEADIQLVMEKTGKNEEDAKRALEEANGDIAEAIVKLGG
jgi:nascent polypeptide-associated complex subunit alpha